MAQTGPGSVDRYTHRETQATDSPLVVGQQSAKVTLASSLDKLEDIHNSVSSLNITVGTVDLSINVSLASLNLTLGTSNIALGSILDKTSSVGSSNIALSSIKTTLGTALVHQASISVYQGKIEAAGGTRNVTLSSSLTKQTEIETSLASARLTLASSLSQQESVVGAFGSLVQLATQVHLGTINSLDNVTSKRGLVQTDLEGADKWNMALETKIVYTGLPGAGKKYTLYWNTFGANLSTTAAMSSIKSWDSQEIALTSTATPLDTEYYITNSFNKKGRYLYTGYTCDDVTKALGTVITGLNVN